MNKTVNNRNFPLQNYHFSLTYARGKTCFITYFLHIHYEIILNYCFSIYYTYFSFDNFHFETFRKHHIKKVPQPCFHMTRALYQIYARLLILETWLLLHKRQMGRLDMPFHPSWARWWSSRWWSHDTPSRWVGSACN